VGALLVGVTAAKSIAYLENKPLVPVHHLEGHVASVYLDQSQDKMKGLEYPSIVAVISGGHTNLYLAENSPDQWDHTFLNKSLIGSSRDDAAGEAFDKIAKLLGFPYPGGVYIDQQAQGKNAKAFQFPRALKMKDNLEFSFSGLKTAASLEISKLKQLGTLQAQTGDLCASVQEAIVDSIFFKISRAKQIHRCKSVVVVGGVSANTRLRERLKSELEVGSVFFPEMKYCTDNAAMIALAGGLRFMKGYGLTGENMLSLNAQATADV
jgi:N6-L-threonylcarbamoyladenine synthase